MLFSSTYRLYLSSSVLVYSKYMVPLTNVRQYSCTRHRHIHTRDCTCTLYIHTIGCTVRFILLLIQVGGGANNLGFYCPSACTRACARAYPRPTVRLTSKIKRMGGQILGFCPPARACAYTRPNARAPSPITFFTVVNSTVSRLGFISPQPLSQPRFSTIAQTRVCTRLPRPTRVRRHLLGALFALRSSPSDIYKKYERGGGGHIYVVFFTNFLLGHRWVLSAENQVLQYETVHPCLTLTLIGKA